MKLLSDKQLRDYVPGKGCLCGAWNEDECCCNVDWTPKEIYVLRNKVKRLRSQLAKSRAASGTIEEQILNETRKAVQR